MPSDMALPLLAVKCRLLLRRTIRKLKVMPTLFRLLTVLAIIAVVGYGAMWALANLLEPPTRTITITVPQDRIGK
jgi:SNF family Na+-dependent transporter